MPTLSGISSFGGAGNTDMTVDITNNNLILNSLSFKTLGCDEVLGDVMQVGVSTTFDPASVADAAAYWNVGKELARCRRVADMFGRQMSDFPTFGSNPFSITGSSPAATLRITNGVYRIWADSIKGSIEDAAQPNITSLGALTTLTVNGSLFANTELITPNVFCTSFTSSTADTTLVTAAQPNVTSLGTLTGLTMGGHIQMGVNQLRVGSGTTDFVRICGKDGGAAFDGLSVGGPVIAGESGGILGTTIAGTQKCALRWSTGGAVGIGSTGSISGVLDVAGNSFFRGRIFTNGVATAGTIMPQGTHMAWNFAAGQGETDFITKSGAGPGGFHFYNTTGDNTAFSVNTNLIAYLVPNEGLVVPSNYIRSRQIFCRVETNSAGIFTVVNTTASIFSSGAGGTTVTHDLRPATMAVGGVTAGAYRIPVAGLYRITVNARFADGGGGTKGLLLKRWNGSTASNVFNLPDGVMWCPDDGAGRRSISFSTVAQFAQLEEVYPTVHTANSQMVWAIMTVVHVSIP